MLISKNKVNPAALAAFINGNGFHLPEDYRLFLEKYNGGETPNTSVKTKTVSSDIKVFFGAGTVPYSLETVSTIDKSGTVFLPIALDSFGNTYVLDVTGKKGVFFVDHEKNREVEPIADSFRKFLAVCRSEPVKESAKRTPEEREQIMIEKGKEAHITDGLRKMWQAEYEKYSRFVQEEVII